MVSRPSDIGKNRRRFGISDQVQRARSRDADSFRTQDARR
jgi:hypothetical protein